MRAAIYARYSSDLQSEASIEDQVRQCRRRIEAEGWQAAEVYSDHAISGATTLRPGYQKLLADARSDGFDVVVAEALDRLSRDQEDIAGLFKQLSFAGVAILTLAEGEISELHVGLKGTMNALFLKDLAQKTHRGLEGRVRQGRSGGGLCYGYDVVKEHDAAGDRIAGGRRINPAEAGIVRRIFTEFAAGKSPRAIAKALNAEGIPGPRGRPWGDTTIRGHHTRRTGILHNELYIGRLVWNKQRYVKDPQTGKRLARLNPESDWVVQPVPDLRILEQDLWQRAEARLQAIRQSPMVQKAQKTRFWEKRRPRHLLTGLAACGHCGGTMITVGRHYMGCGNARRHGTCDNRQSMPRPELEAIILDGLKRQLMQPDLVKTFIQAFHQEVNRLSREQDGAVEVKQKELVTIDRKLDGLIDAIADGLRSEGLQGKLDELEQRKAALAAEIEQAPPPAPRLHPNLAELYRRKVAELHQVLADEGSRQEAILILRGLIEKVVLQPTADGYEIELVGDIAAMVELGGGANKKAAPEEAALPALYRRSTKVVAGACNHRELTLCVEV